MVAAVANLEKLALLLAENVIRLVNSSLTNQSKSTTLNLFVLRFCPCPWGYGGGGPAGVVPYL